MLGCCSIWANASQIGIPENNTTIWLIVGQTDRKLKQYANEVKTTNTTSTNTKDESSSYLTIRS